jgi:hypothetical protein
LSAGRTVSGSLAIKARRALLSTPVTGAFEDPDSLLSDLFRSLFRQGPYCLLHPTQDILDGDRRWSHSRIQALAQGRVSRFFQWHITQIDRNILVLRRSGPLLY